MGATEKGFSKEVMLKLNLKKEVTHNSPSKLTSIVYNMDLMSLTIPLDNKDCISLKELKTCHYLNFPV